LGLLRQFHIVKSRSQADGGSMPYAARRGSDGDGNPERYFRPQFRRVTGELQRADLASRHSNETPTRGKCSFVWTKCPPTWHWLTRTKPVGRCAANQCPDSVTGLTRAVSGGAMIDPRLSGCRKSFGRALLLT
jgi:hypothetical protein